MVKTIWLDLEFWIMAQYSIPFEMKKKHYLHSTGNECETVSVLLMLRLAQSIVGTSWWLVSPSLCEIR